MKKTQIGATLIIVLLLLIAITIIGSLAVRSSILSLKVATISQAQQLLMQNSDAVFFKVEDPAQLVKNMALNGMFGYIKGEDNVGKELVFCLKSDNTNFFNLSKSSLISWGGTGTTIDAAGLGDEGFCKIASGFFTSGRNTVITQIAVKAMDVTDAVAFQHMQKGTDPESSKKDPAQMYTIFATSVFPSLAAAEVKDTDINKCFNSRFNSIPSSKQDELDLKEIEINADETLNETQKAEKAALLNAAKVTVFGCLNALGVPTNTQVTRYALTQTLSK